MEVSYKRHFNQSYMILKNGDSQQEAHELAVLAHNKIPGLLSVETEVADGSIRFWYDITGRQTLNDYLARRQADNQLLQALFRGMEQVLEKVSDYLLDEECILLKEEYIYLDFAHENVEFVYLPGWKKDSRASFRELMELLLQRLNHSDKQATAIAYEMYQRSLGQEESFSAMLKQALEVEQEEVDNEISKEESLEQSEEMWEQSRLCEPPKLWGKSASCEQPKLWEQPKKNVGWLRQKIRFREKQQEQEQPYVPQREEMVSHPTEVLNAVKGVRGILVYQGSGELLSMQINKPLFVIGKQAEEVDGHIDGISVSRVHARIEVEEGDYYIEDLNSTNGTYLNGERLEYHQKVKLAVRDRIAFGMEEYVFM